MFAEEDEEDDGKLDDEVVDRFLRTNVQQTCLVILTMEFPSINVTLLLLCLGALCSMEYNQGICGVNERQASVTSNWPS